MKYISTLISVSDIDRSVRFYRELFGLETVSDFGSNKVLSGGIALQTADTWRAFLGESVTVRPGGCDGELYFEEEDFDLFVQRLARFKAPLVHPVKEHSWGQRVVRFFDPDGHIIEVGECMASVVRRFVDGGLTPQQTAKRMDVPLSYIDDCLRQSAK